MTERSSNGLTPEWSPTMLLRGDMEHPKHSGRYLVGVDEDSYAEALSEIDRQRAEIELLTKQRDRDVMYIADMEDTISRAAKALGVTNSDALLEKLENPAHETGNDPGVILNELWSACRVVFYPELDDLRGNYPIEHAPGAAKDARDLIEARLAERILQRAKSSQKTPETADEWASRYLCPECGEEQGHVAAYGLVCANPKCSRDHFKYARAPEKATSEWLTDEQCDDVIAFLEDYEWTGLTRENVRTWCTAIAEATSSVNGSTEQG